MFEYTRIKLLTTWLTIRVTNATHEVFQLRALAEREINTNLIWRNKSTLGQHSLTY